jgi:hypothetical protein
MTQFIVTTTIYPPSKALKLFANKKEWQLIVVGDKKTPHEEFRRYKNIIYLDPEYQETNYKDLSDLTGWNCTTRRNFGYLEAIKRGGQIIASIDDDNIPLEWWGENLLLNKYINMHNYFSIDNSIKVFDPFSPTNYNNLWHRGYPLELVHRKNNITKNTIPIKADIQADFWNGDPDIDAIERMIYSPDCIFDDTPFPFTSELISPFNSQNTFLTKKALQNYYMFPNTGRMEDIWAAYYCIANGNKVIYNKASVIQERNPHDYLIDFNNEIIGYQNNIKLIDSILQNPENIKNYITDNSYKSLLLYKKYITSY